MPYRLTDHVTRASEASARSLSLTQGALEETRRDNKQGLGALGHPVVPDGLRGLGAGSESTERAGKEEISVWKGRENTSSQQVTEGR